jgi:hypothetical protein
MANRTAALRELVAGVRLDTSAVLSETRPPGAVAVAVERV